MNINKPTYRMSEDHNIDWPTHGVGSGGGEAWPYHQQKVPKQFHIDNQSLRVTDVIVSKLLPEYTFTQFS